MVEIPSHMMALALGKANGEPLTIDERDIWEEVATGKAWDNLKVDTNDPRILDYCSLWDKLEYEQDAVWEGIVAAHSIENPVQKDK